MKIGSISSTESKPCALCNRKTSTYKIYEQSNIAIKIPLCDTEERKCFRVTDVKDIASLALKLIKKVIPGAAE